MSRTIDPLVANFENFIPCHYENFNPCHNRFSVVFWNVVPLSRIFLRLQIKVLGKVMQIFLEFWWFRLSFSVGLGFSINYCLKLYCYGIFLLKYISRKPISTQYKNVIVQFQALISTKPQNHPKTTLNNLNQH